MQNELLPIPEAPAALREAAQIGTLVPFVGAGVSRLAGCPDWDTLANETLRLLNDQREFSHAQLDQVKHLSPRVKLSIALSLTKEKSIPIDFRHLLHPTPRKEHDQGRRIYSHLSKLSTTFVTTNYDEWLDEDLPASSGALVEGDMATADNLPQARTIYHKPEDLTAASLNQENVVIHLHGSAKHPDGMILTTPQYVQHYANDRRSADDFLENYVLTFLEYLFENKTVLFVGYGLAELEILEYVIVKAGRKKVKGLQPKHFLLQGFYSHERELMASMRTYYRECGIELVPFLKDQEGWTQLIDVLESFGDSIPTSRPTVVQEFKEMEALLE